jgi:hypothetical protein
MNTVETPTQVDAVARYCAASSVNDLEGMLATLAPDAELVSPLSAHLVIRGRGDLRVLLGAIYSSLHGLHWDPPAWNGSRAYVVGSSRVAGLQVDDAMIFEIGPDGSIIRLRPHLRPWLGTSVLALVLGIKLAPHFDVILRAAAPTGVTGGS